MSIEITPGHFTAREQAIAAIEASKLFLIETEVRPENLNPVPHVHPYDVDIYILDGIMELHEPGTGRDYVLKAGTKALVPANTQHWESAPGTFQAAFGLSKGPAVILAARAL